MSNFSHTQFNKGDQVEVLKRENGPNTSTYYPAIVLKPSKKQVFVEYQTLMINESTGPKRITESVGLGFVRPNPPRGAIEYFKVDDNVDVYCDNGWHKGIVRDILENSKYVVGFVGQCSDGIVTEQCNLRLHREWDDGSWIPPLLGQSEKSEMEVKTRKMRLKIKCSQEKVEPIFRKKALVEVRSDEEGYEGAWFGAIIVGPVGTDDFLVQYLNLVTNDGTQPFSEIVKARNIRPNPPQGREVVDYKPYEKVDVWFNDGWWEGAIKSVLNGLNYMVYFSSTNDTMEFEHARLRPHQDWINGKWFKGKQDVLEGNGRNTKPMFSKGTKVEVKSDEAGFQGSWFPATIVKVMVNHKFLVQYQTLVTDDETDFLREEANVQDIRPSPPQIQRAYPFAMSEIVDAWYNDGWWVGRIIKVQDEFKYTVHFKTAEKLEFEHCQLRPHQEWINGNWITVPKNWKF